jgi:hypothetical protein
VLQRTAVVRFRYFDPAEQSTVEGDVRAGGEMAELLTLVGSLRADRSPAVELVGGDGSSLVVGVSGERAVLLFTDAAGAATHSVATSAGDRSGVVFDFFGSYTELPGSYAVPVGVAVEAADGFAAGARPPVASGLQLAED